MNIILFYFNFPKEQIYMPFQKVQMPSISSKKVLLLSLIMGFKNRNLKKKKSVNNGFEVCFIVHFHPLWTLLLLILFIHYFSSHGWYTIF
jgi:hypothetical protein